MLSEVEEKRDRLQHVNRHRSDPPQTMMSMACRADRTSVGAARENLLFSDGTRQHAPRLDSKEELGPGPVASCYVGFLLI
jgi:hypothetical protein